jgi:hypothetical protein
VSSGELLPEPTDVAARHAPVWPRDVTLIVGVIYVTWNCTLAALAG